MTGNPATAPAEELIRRQARAARLACEQMTGPTLRILRASVERASRLPSRPGWEQKAAAHAELFRLLADVAGDPAAAGQHGGAPLLCDLMLTVGPAANGMILSSRQRLLACLRTGDPDGAAREMREHLHVLHYMERLAHVRG